MPYSEDIRVEWVGYRPAAKERNSLPPGSEEQRYKALMNEPHRTSKVTTLYFHGGAYYMCGFGTHRPLLRKLAQETAGRVLAVEYRLAPQSAFPAQLIDALNAYLYLLYPVGDASLHKPVDASHIVFAGDSAGGNLALALRQLLLEMHRCKAAGVANPIIRFSDREVQVPLPAGVSACSGWFDLTRSLPSNLHNASFDYLPSVSDTDPLSRLPKDQIWPSDPPRGDLFCDLSLLCHPLVSVVAAADWSHAPPIWISTGQEMLTDEDAFVAERARQNGVVVHYEQYEAMPHCAMMILPHLRSSRRGLRSWGTFINRCVDSKERVQSRSVLILASGQEVPIDDRLSRLSREQVMDSIKSAQHRRTSEWEATARDSTGFVDGK